MDFVISLLSLRLGSLALKAVSVDGKQSAVVEMASDVVRTVDLSETLLKVLPCMNYRVY